MQSRFAIAKSPTPLLSTSEWHMVFPDKEPLPLEKRSGLLRPVEGVAFPGTKFTLLEERKREEGHSIFLIQSKGWGSSLWVDSRFLTFCSTEPEERKIALPTKEAMIDFLYACYAKKIPYIWGGNYHLGIPELLTYYPSFSKEEKTIRTLSGLDCSGLIYEMTDGFTPRNTSQMLEEGFGVTIPIKGLSVEEILSRLQPLDLIVHKGHVVIFLNSEAIIESRHHKGIVITPPKERILEILESKVPSNRWNSPQDFIVKRWLP